MCGITGFLFPSRYSLTELTHTLHMMTTALAARGPDDEGHWIDETAGVALGHRRLSVVDLSSAGHQPMTSASERYVIVFNGEIYNHLEIRQELDGDWKGASDTETLLAAIDAWGVTGALKRSVGMFAFALWDQVTRTLTLARDRLGEKPLYYGWSNGMFIFTSELKAFHAIPGFSPVIDRMALWHYFSQRAIPAPHSIYEGIHKLEPGQVFTCQASSGLSMARVNRDRYWSLHEALCANPFGGTPEEAVEELTRLFTQSVALQMVADVPVGAFLSGGIDSTTVVALMQSMSGRPIQTYTIGFEEDRFDESSHAAAVARYLGTNHEELTVTATEALQVIPRLPEIWDEPFADSSQIPTAILASLVRRGVTVALSGDGGDELFCGYERHLTAAALERVPAKPFLSALLFVFSLPSAQMHLRSLPLGRRSKQAVDRLGLLSELLSLKDPTQRYLSFNYAFEFSSCLLGGIAESYRDPFDASVSNRRDILSLVSAVDAVTYLPTDILTKVDRAAMAVSLETRIPLLDHRLVEFAFSLPSSYKVRNGTTKWPLRQILKSYLPSTLIERPKMGFGVPIREWLRGPLRAWASDLLLSGNSSDDLLNRPMIERMWRDHQSGAWNYSEWLWRILMFRAWQTCHGR